MSYVKETRICQNIFFFILSILSVSQLFGQTISYKPSGLLPLERIHVQTDKDIYFPGETIWFKTYLINGFLPDTVHTNLFTDIIDQQGGIISHKVFPLEDGISYGSFQLNDRMINQPVVYLRISLSEMDNSQLDQSYYKTLRIISPKNETDVVKAIPEAHVQFFPEGGNFIEHVPNQLAFKAYLQNGLPFPVKGLIKTRDGTIVDSIHAEHDGMGVFTINPEKEISYYLEWFDNQNILRRSDLPQPIEKGITLHTGEANGYLYYAVQNPVAEGPLATIHITASLYQHPFYSTTFDMSNMPVSSGRIPLKDLPTGVIQLTAFDNNGQPLAERMHFVNNGHYFFSADLTIKEKSSDKRGRNQVEITVADTIASNLSLSVYETDFNDEQHRGIYADILLGSDIRGYVHNIDWYFAEASTERKKAIDLLMQTNGWRKYRVPDSAVVKVSDNYIGISGMVIDQKKNLLAKQTITFLLQGKDSTKHFFSVTTDSAGKFKKDGFYFYDSAFIWYQFNKNVKKNTEPKLILEPGFAKLRNADPAAIPAPPFTGLTAMDTGLTFSKKVFFDHVDDGFTTKGLTLGNVTVKSRQWRNDPMLLMDEKYTSGVFRSGANAFSIDVMNDPTAQAKGDIFNFLISRVPGLAIGYGKSGSKMIGKYGRGSFNPLTLIYVDEHKFEFDATEPNAMSEIQYLNIDDIAYVKYFDTDFPLAPLTPTLAIYLKKGDEIDPRNPSGLPKIKITGYGTVKEFYSPDYAVKNNTSGSADIRTTLFWKPVILMDKNNRKATFTFYNNDRPRSYYVVLEGMNEDGKLVRVEKLVEEQK